MDTETDASEGSTATSPGTDQSASESTVGSMEGTGESSGSESSSSGEPCDPGDPECIEPGEALWTVQLGGEDHDGAYGIAIDGDSVVAVGELGVGGSSDPWMIRVALSDGAEDWSEADTIGEGSNSHRGVASLGKGWIAASGATFSGPEVHGFFEVRDAMGGPLATDSFTDTVVSSLLGLNVVNDHVWAVGYLSDTVDQANPRPLLLTYTLGDWFRDYSSLGVGELDTFTGMLFDSAVAPDGNVVVAGFSQTDGTQDAMLILLSAAGDYIDGPFTVGGPHNDDFTGVSIENDGSGVAVGRRGTGATTSELHVVHFSVEGLSIVTGFENTWANTTFVSPNGFARDGDAVFIAAGTSNEASLTAASFDTQIIRFDGEAADPTWVVPFAPESPGRDYGGDVALAPDGTLVACGVVTPEGTENGDAWIRRLKR